MRDIAAAAEHAADLAWDRQCHEEELAEYLEERGITMEQYKAECDEAAADFAADQAYWRDA